MFRMLRRRTLAPITCPPIVRLCRRRFNNQLHRLAEWLSEREQRLARPQRWRWLGVFLCGMTLVFALPVYNVFWERAGPGLPLPMQHATTPASTRLPPGLDPAWRSAVRKADSLRHLDSLTIHPLP